jgi:uncharacterized protein
VRTRRFALAAVVLAVVVIAAPAHAKDKLPQFSAPVVDAAGLVPDQIKQQVDRELIDYRNRSANQIAVAVIKTTGNASLENYTIDLARQWGVGTKGKDNGVLVLIAYDDHKVRIEIGRGLEGTFTDIQAGRIIRDRLIPLLRQGDVGGAVVQGTQAIRAELGDTDVGQLPPPPAQPVNDQPRGNTSGWLFLVFPAAIGLFSVLGRGRGRRHGWGWMPIYWGGGGWGGGGGGGGFGGGGGGGFGGFGGGGGGGFGGGGASGGW